MKLEKRKPSGREKDEQSLKHLEQLRQSLHFADNASARRISAFQLSWMQEDGIEILQEALLGNFAKYVKTAAAYGLRKMHGRMKKRAVDLFTQAIKDSDRNTREICSGALVMMTKPASVRYGKRRSTRPSNSARYRITEVSPRPRRTRRVSHTTPSRQRK